MAACWKMGSVAGSITGGANPCLPRCVTPPRVRRHAMTSAPRCPVDIQVDGGLGSFRNSRVRKFTPPTHKRYAVTQAGDKKMESLLARYPVSELAPPKPFSEMPGPVGLPFIGTLWEYIRKDGYGFRKLFKVFQERARQYGPVYKEEIAKRLSVIVTDPHEYAKVVRADGKYPIRMEMGPFVHYRNIKGICLGTVNSQGAEWHRHRAVMSRKTLRHKEVTNFSAPMSRVADSFITRLLSLVDEKRTITNLEFELFKWALESLGTFVFEERLGCFDSPPSERGQRYLRHLAGFFQYLQLLMYDFPVYKLYPSATWRQYEKHADVVHSIALQLVNEKIESIKRSDSNLTSPSSSYDVAERGESEAGASFLTYIIQQENLTPEEASSHAVDLLIGGVETTSTAVLWTLYCLSRSPDAQREAFREISELLPEGGDVTPNVLTKLTYLRACLRETFRLYPITFATSRVIQEDLEIGGYMVPSGTHVQANLYGMGRERKFFSEPEVYRPERWLRENMTSQEKAVGAFANLPWGHGPRMCLGRRLAEQEIFIGLIKILRTFEVKYHGPAVEPILNTVMTPDQPLNFTFVHRK